MVLILILLSFKAAEWWTTTMQSQTLFILYMGLSLERCEEMVSSYWGHQLTNGMEEALFKTKNKPKNK